MRRTWIAYAALSMPLVACGSETADVATDDPTTSVAPTQGPPSETSSETSSETPSETSSETPGETLSEEPEPSVDPDPAVVEGLGLAFDQDALTVTMVVPGLVATDRLLMLYQWQTRDVRVAVETTLVGGEPVLNAVWSDNQTEMSGDVKDVEAVWDLEAGTVTITLRDRLNGDRAEVSALGLGPKDRYPAEPAAYAVTESVERT